MCEMSAADLLRTYLQDHHAGSTAGLELARRAAGANAESEYGAELAELAGEIESDQERLEEIMAKLEVRPSKVKDGALWAAEKAGRLKPNNRLTGYSPLSRVIELEGLVIGVTGKLALWRSLAQLGDERLAEFDLAALAAGAESQRERIEGLRVRAVREAFGVVDPA